jgi:hypothetical protein
VNSDAPEGYEISAPRVRRSTAGDRLFNVNLNTNLTVVFFKFNFGQNLLGYSNQ